MNLILKIAILLLLTSTSSFAQSESDEGALKRLIMEDMKAKGEKPNLAAVKSTFKNIIAKKEISYHQN